MAEPGMAALAGTMLVFGVVALLGTLGAGGAPGVIKVWVDLILEILLVVGGAILFYLGVTEK